MINAPYHQPQESSPAPSRQLIILVVLLIAIVLLCAFFGIRYALFLREAAAERVQVNQYNVPLLKGPITPGGPLVGEGAAADLELTDNGWDRTQTPDGVIHGTIFATVRNKSNRSWKRVQVIMEVSDAQGNNVNTIRGNIGTIDPGQELTTKLPDQGDDVKTFTVTGIDGQ